MIAPARSNPAVLDAILSKLNAIEQRNARVETRLVILANALGHGDKMAQKSQITKGPACAPT